MSKEVIKKNHKKISKDTTDLNLQELSITQVRAIFLELPNISSITFYRECYASEMYYISNFLLTSTSCITHLGLSGVGIDTGKARALSKALEANKTIQSLDLSSNKMSYEEMTLIFDALSTNCKPLAEEFMYASQRFFANTYVLKPKNSLPLRELDISKNVQKSAEPSAKERFVSKLSDFLNKNWTLGSLNLSGINTGDWGIDDIKKICSGIEGHNEDKRLQSKIENLDISCNQLSYDDIELFAKTHGIKKLTITRNETMYKKQDGGFECTQFRDLGIGEEVQLGGEGIISSTISFSDV